MLKEFDEQGQKAIVIAESISFDFGHQNVGSEHLLLSLLKIKDNDLKKQLELYDVTAKMIEEDIKRLFGVNDNQPFYLEYSQNLKNILERSIEYTKQHQQDKVTINNIAISLLQETESVAYELLQKYHIDTLEIIYQLQEKTAYETSLDQINTLININKKVSNKNYKIIGREKELNQIQTILAKKEKNNVLIIGEAGVGKTAIIEKLAMLINENKVIEPIKNKIIYELSLTSLVAGTKYRGEFEEKFKKIIDKAKQLNNVIIFIDEIHNVIGAGGAEGAIDASNILKPFLARKEITVIGATTVDEYYKHFLKDHAMNRRFTIVNLKENTKEETIEIIKGIKSYYETYHKLIIDNKTINQLVSLVDIHLKNKTYPDKAIDILDLACVTAKANNENKLTEKTIIKTIENTQNINLQTTYNQQKLNNLLPSQQEPIKQILAYLPKKPKNLPLSLIIKGINYKTLQTLSKILNYNYLKINLNQYQSYYTNQQLFNKSSPLLITIQNKPHTILVLENINQISDELLYNFIQIIAEGYYEISYKRKVNFENTIILFVEDNLQQGIGFKKDNYLTNMIDQELINKVNGIIEYLLEKQI